MRSQLVAFVLFFLSSCQGPKDPLLIVDLSKGPEEFTEADRVYVPLEITYSSYGDPKSLTAAIRLRGNYSLVHPKKSIDIKFDKDFPLKNLQMQRRWLLNANYIDKTFIRNKLSYDLFRKMGGGKAARSEFVLLRVGGLHYGIYELMERIDKDYLELSKDKCACLFKDVNYSVHPDSIPVYRLALQNYFATDPRFDAFSPYDRKTIVENAFYDQKYPDLNNKSKHELVDHLSRFIHLSSDSVFNSQVWEIFDRHNILRWHLLLLMSNNGDGVIKNYYLYRESCKTKWKIIPWDYEHGFGRDGDGEENHKEIISIERNALLNRLWSEDVGNYRSELLKLFISEKEKSLKYESVNQFVQKELNKLESYLPKEAERWPYEENQYFAGSDYEKEYQLLLSWYKERLQRIEHYLKENVNEGEL